MDSLRVLGFMTDIRKFIGYYCLVLDSQRRLGSMTDIHKFIDDYCFSLVSVNGIRSLGVKAGEL